MPDFSDDVRKICSVNWGMSISSSNVPLSNDNILLNLSIINIVKPGCLWLKILM